MHKSRFITLVILAFVLVFVAAPGVGRASGLQQGAITYTVQVGDNLSNIAARYGTSVSAIVQANGLNSTVIHVGQVLTISGGAGAGVAASGSSRSSAGGVHIVRAGESLWSIANTYGVSMASLRARNRLAGDVILPGQSLVIPSSSGGSASTWPSGSSTGCAGSYTVRSGDTLYSIADRCGVSVSSLIRGNGLSGSRIYPGQSLQVAAGSGSASRPSAGQPYTAPPAGQFTGAPPSAPPSLPSSPPSSPASPTPVVVPFPTPVPPFPPLFYPTPGP